MPEQAVVSQTRQAKVNVKLLRDHWFEADVRTSAGTVVAMEESEARAAINEGRVSFEGVSEK